MKQSFQIKAKCSNFEKNLDMKKLLFLAVAAGMFLACGQDKAIVKQIDDQAVAIHDEVMPKMGDVIALKGELKAKIESLDSTQLDERATHEEVFEALATAEQGMKDWMHGYVMPDYKKPLEELEPLVKAQLESIETVKANMEKSITDAKTLLGK